MGEQKKTESRKRSQRLFAGDGNIRGINAATGIDIVPKTLRKGLLAFQEVKLPNKMSCWNIRRK
jgi:hypothetical protein